MNQKFLFATICTVVLSFLMACGNGQNKAPSGSQPSEAQGVFAEVMALVSEYQEKDDQLNVKMQAAGEAQDMEEVEKLMKEQQTFKSDFKEQLAAISQRLAGTEIAYELPDSFFYQIATPPTVTEVTPNGLNATGVIQFSISTKKDLKIGKYKGDDYRIFIKLLDESGHSLGIHAYRTIADDRQPQEIKAGTRLQPVTVSIILAENSHKEAPVTKLVFVSENEWSQSLNYK